MNMRLKIFQFFRFKQSGDINGDGIVNVLDIVLIVNTILDNNEYNPIADFNGDGQLDITDIVQFISIILRINSILIYIKLNTFINIANFLTLISLSQIFNSMFS